MKGVLIGRANGIYNVYYDSINQVVYSYALNITIIGIKSIEQAIDRCAVNLINFIPLKRGDNK